MPQSTVGRIESGAVDPRVSTLDRLLRACGDELDAVSRRGVGVDRTLSRDLLRRSPRERVEEMASASRNLEVFRGAARRPG